MRSALILLVAAFLTVPAPALAENRDGPIDTVRVLVPDDLDSGSTKQLGSRKSRSGWRRIEAPLHGRGAAGIPQALAALGPEAILENVYPLAAPSDEPLFAEQWGLENTGQTGGIPDADVDASEAWTVSTGTGVIVAIVDSGVDATHPELTGQLWSNPGETLNGIDDDGNGLKGDVVGWDYIDGDNDPSPVRSGSSAAHGTMVAGIVASSVNGIGITGIAPDARIMNIRACDAGTCWSLDVANAIFYAVNQGADIINLSLGGPNISDPPMKDAIQYARQNGVVVVAAAGNDSLNIDALPNGEIMIPADLPIDNIISVAASDHRDDRALFSNYGADSVDVFAPGEEVPTTGTAGQDDYVFASGTSFSNAFVAGIAALLISHDPSIGYRELIARVEGFVDRPTGLSGLAKYGRVNAGTTMTERFIDTSGSVFVNAIDWLAGENITEGCNPPENHEYCPQDKVTGGELAVFFSRAFGLPATSVDYFTNDEGAFYESAANRMFEAGVTVGCAPGKYCGNRDITREELAAMLARVLKLPTTSNDHFTDDEESIFEGAINKIAEASLTNGCNPPDNDQFCPTDKVTRGQMAAFIKRVVSVLNS